MSSFKKKKPLNLNLLIQLYDTIVFKQKHQMSQSQSLFISFTLFICSKEKLQNMFFPFLKREKTKPKVEKKANLRHSDR